MSDRELEEIRRRKMEEMLQHQSSGGDSSGARDEQDATKASLLRQILTIEARERLARLRLTNPDVVELVESQLLTLYQGGRLRGMVDDRALLGILKQLMPGKREINIERR